MPGNESEGMNMLEQRPGEAAGIQSGCRGLAEAAEMQCEVRGPAGSPTAMLIRIFGKKDREPYGDIVHHNLGRPVPYQGAAQLVLRIDAISRSLDLPPSDTAFRSIQGRSRDGTGNVLPREYWQGTDTGVQGKAREETGNGLSDGYWQEKETGNGLPDEYWQKADTSPPGRVRDTIYLQLIGRQHTSIQGRIWGKATRKKYVSFRSALELIYLLSEAV